MQQVSSQKHGLRRSEGHTHCRMSSLPQVLGHTPAVGADGIPEVKSTPGIVGTLLTVLKWTCMALLYGGFTAVCVGAFAMDPCATFFRRHAQCGPCSKTMFHWFA